LSNTLEKLVENEKGEKKRKATEGLMWLLRGLQFTCKALQGAQANTSEELAVAFSKSYDVTLKAFHNFVVKGIFSVSPFTLLVSIRRSFCSGRAESLPLSCGFLQQVEG
jgi:glutathione peroxidase-family protein